MAIVASASADRPGLRTEFDFALPMGYVDSSGTIHREGRMRLSTAMDEIAPQRDSRVKSNQAYLTIVILSRVITKLGDLPSVDTDVVEGLFTADLAFLQDFYRRVNTVGATQLTATCPKCGHTFPVEEAEPGGS
jgi:hypothetical protein